MTASFSWKLRDDFEQIVHHHALTKKFLQRYWHIEDIVACFAGTNKLPKNFETPINSIRQKRSIQKWKLNFNKFF